MKSTGRLIAALAATFAIAGSRVELNAQTAGLFSGVTGGSSVAAYTIGATGAITAITGSPFTSPANVNGVAVDPTGQYLYATTASKNVTGFRIGATGILTAAPGSPCATGSNPTAVIVDPSGRFVYAVNSGASTISACAIGQAGSLTALSGSPFSTGQAPKGIATDSSGHLYVASFSGNAVYGYTIGADGSLTPVAGSPFTAGFQPIGIAVTGTFLYVANNGSQSISAFTIGTGGGLTEVTGSPYLAEVGPYGIAIPAGGAHLYLTNQITQAISAFAIGMGGALSTVAGSPYATAFVPAAITADPTGQFVYVTSQNTSQAAGYSVGGSGALTALTGSPFTTAGSSVSIASQNFDTNEATHLSVTVPNPVTSSGNHPVTVRALDQSNNLATGYNGIVQFTSTDPGWTAAPDIMLVNGSGVSNASLKTAGSQIVTATDTLVPSITGSFTTTVVPGPLNRLDVAAPPAVTAGVSFSVTIRSTDLFGNTISSYNGTVHITSTDPAGTVPADSPLTNGARVFSVTLRTAGLQAINVTDNGSLVGSYSLGVNPSTATHISVSTPGTATAGSSFTVALTALDMFNNIAAGYTGTVHVTSSDGQAPVIGNTTPFTSGQGSISATLKTAGIQTITATDTVTSSITGTSPSITVSAGAATHFSVSAQASATAGTAFNFTVTALDTFGNTVNGYAGTVHFTSTDGQAVLQANSALANGTGAFSATLKTAGSQTITATDTLNGSITGMTGTIAVAAGPATHFTVSAPGAATAGVAFNFTVTSLDASNNNAALYSGIVHFTSSDGQAVLPPNSALAGGSGTFSVTLKTTGAQTVSATDTVTGSITGTSGTITVASPILQSIAVTPAGPSIVKGLTQQFTAIGTYSDNSTQNLTSLATWISFTTSVATISNAAGTQGLATGVNVGTSNIVASLSGVTSAADVLTVNMISQTISFPNPGNQIYGVPFNLSATATSGLMVMFQSLTTNTCTVSGTQATFISLAACTIQASQAGDGSYLAAAPVNQTFTPVLNVTGRVSVTQDGFGRNRATGLWTATMTVTNISGAPIAGPVSVGIGNLSADATMVDNTGLFQGQPYILTSIGTLGAGASVSLAIQFQDPSAGYITFIPMTYSGALQTNTP